MQPERSADPDVCGALADWYRARSGGERLALALSLSLALHAGSALWLPALSLHPAVRRGGAGTLTVALRPSVPPLSPSTLPSGGLPAASPPVMSTVATQPSPHAGAAPSTDDAVAQAEPEASTPAMAPLAAPEGESAAGEEGEGYFAAGELDVLARPLQPIALALPPDAPAGKTRLMLRLYINERGGVDAVEVELGDPSGVLEREARRVFQDARFVPGQRQGRAVKSYKRIEVWMEN